MKLAKGSGRGLQNLFNPEAIEDVQLEENLPVKRQFPDGKIVETVAGMWPPEADLPDEDFEEGKKYRKQATIKITGWFPAGDLKGLTGTYSMLEKIMFEPGTPQEHFKAMCRNHQRGFVLAGIEKVEVEGYGNQLERKKVDATKKCREVRVTLDVTEHPDAPIPWEVMTRKQYEVALEEAGMLNFEAGEKLVSVRVDGTLVVEPTDGLAAPEAVQ
jgi:hypothetical protein